MAAILYPRLQLHDTHNLNLNAWSNQHFQRLYLYLDIFEYWVILSEFILTLSPPSTTKVHYGNRLNPDETQSNSESHPDPSFLTLRHFQQL